MKTQYYIIGSGGFAKEVYFLANQVLDDSNQFMGFIDFKPKEPFVNVRKEQIPVIEESFFLENISPHQSLSIYFGIGDPGLLHKLSEKFYQYNFPNLIHPNFIGDSQSIDYGKGNIIAAGCIFTVDIKIGSYNIFNLNTTIGHDAIIGDCNIFNPGANISGAVNIGHRNLLGTNSTILQGIIINDDNILGAASLANKNIGYNSIMVGVPAKPMKND